jgi:hypothetical protein
MHPGPDDAVSGVAPVLADHEACVIVEYDVLARERRKTGAKENVITCLSANHPARLGVVLRSAPVMGLH